MTPQRFEKIRRVLARRQPDLTVLMDRVHKPHNLAAITRSADAVGLLEVHAVVPAGGLRLPHLAAGGVRRWVTLRTHPDIRSAASVMKARGLRIVAATPTEDATPFREFDYRDPVAIMVGSELEGLSADAIDAADEHLFVPQEGMVSSLNVSVATALILFEAYRQRLEAGLYDRCRLDPEVYRRTLFEWSYPRVARALRSRGLPVPELDARGDFTLAAAGAGPR